MLGSVVRVVRSGLLPPSVPAGPLDQPGRSSSHTGLRPFALSRSHAAGCFLCTGFQARGVHKKHNTHQSTSGPLPCTIEAITRSGTDTPSSRPTGPFHPTSGKINSRKFAVASGVAETTLRGLGWGYAGFLTPIGVMLAAFVARNCFVRIQVVAFQLRENFRSAS